VWSNVPESAVFFPFSLKQFMLLSTIPLPSLLSQHPAVSVEYRLLSPWKTE